MNKQHPFIQLTNLVNEFSENRESFDSEKLQDIRERISLTLFYLSDDASKAIANFDKADYERKRNFAELVEKHKYDDDGNKNTVSTAESLARIDNKEFEEALVVAIKQKERVRIILTATKEILNSIASRLNNIKQ